MQATIYAPLLSFSFIVLGFLSLNSVFNNKALSLVITLVALLGSNSYPYALASREWAGIDALLHVPFHALGLATGQSLGWVLFIPAICTLYKARETNKYSWMLASGAVLGLLFHVHTLTFINIFFIHVFYSIFEVVKNEKSKNRKICIFVFYTAAILITFFINNSRMSLGNALMLGIGFTIANALIEKKWKFYFVTYATSMIVALPFIWYLISHRHQLPIDAATGSEIGPIELLKFYCLYVVALMVLVFVKKDSNISNWLFAVFFATLLLSFNASWGWGNHPYRFAIHLIFPLSIALGWCIFIKSHVVVRALLAIWLIIMIGANAYDVFNWKRIYQNYTIGTVQEAEFYKSVHSNTNSNPGLIINPPEFQYPIGSTQSAMILSYSSNPGLIPDYRYMLESSIFKNRMDIFCNLFPSYPHFNYHTGLRSCGIPFDESSVVMKNQYLKNTILDLYSVRHVASAGEPFGGIVRSSIQKYGWRTIATAPGGFELVEPRMLEKDDVLRLHFSFASDGKKSIKTTVEKSGAYTLVLASRNLDDLNTSEILKNAKIKGHWLVNSSNLDAGHQDIPLNEELIDLISKDGIYFIALINSKKINEYFEINF